MQMYGPSFLEMFFICNNININLNENFHVALWNCYFYFSKFVRLVGQKNSKNKNGPRRVPSPKW